jgi:hypothetical protein
MKGDILMLNWQLQSRYWSPHQEYATGDVLVGLISQGWEIVTIQPAPIETRARLHLITLQRDDQSLKLPVLDGPVVHTLVMS